MGKKIKFKYKEIEDLNKVIVYIDYIDREFFNPQYNEKWKYGGVDFSVETYIKTDRGLLDIYYSNGKMYNFELYIGLKDNFFVIDKKEVKIFKDLENKVYSDIKILSEYLCSKDVKGNKDIKYYFINFKSDELKFCVNVYNLEFDKYDRKFFDIGNMFNSKEEIEKYVDKLNSNKITLDEFSKERKEFFKNYEFE